MSGMITAVAAMVAVSAYSAYSSNQNANKSLKAQNAAQDEARQNAAKQEKAADEATNANNMKSPDTGAMMSAALQAGRGGVSSTMLTGASGIDPNKLNLGKNTLLGQ